MDKDKFKELTKKANGGRINHNTAVNNSISIGDLPDTAEGLFLYRKVVDQVAKFVFQLFHSYDPTEYLLGGQIQVSSKKMKGGTEYAKYLGTDYARNENFVGKEDIITFNYDHRKQINTAGNIASLFEHEHYFHGFLGLRQKWGKFDVHYREHIYKMQVESPIFKYTSGEFRETELNAAAKYK